MWISISFRGIAASLCLAWAALPAQGMTFQENGSPFAPWTLNHSSAAGLTASAYGSGLFVVAGEDMAAEGRVLLSSNAVDWIEISPPSLPAMASMTFGDGRFVGVGRGADLSGAAAVSSNGVDWVVAHIPGAGAMLSVAHGDGKFVANSATAVYVSSDGLSWEKRLAESNLRAVAFGNHRFVLVALQGIAVSLDGFEWTSFQQGYNNWTATFGGGRFLFLNRSVATRSENAYLFEETPIQCDSNPSAAGFGSGVFLANQTVAGAEEPYLLLSADGKAWETIPIPFSQITSFAHGAGTFVATSYNGGIMTSPDGRVWTVRRNDQVGDFTGMAKGDGSAVIVGYDSSAPVVLRSTNGTNWARQAIQASGQLEGVVFAEGRHVAVGTRSSGGRQIFSSPDGIEWTARFADTQGSLKAVAYGGGSWVAVGYNGEMLVSSNSVDWTLISLGVESDFSHVAYGNGMFVAAGGELEMKPPDFFRKPALYSSPDGIHWTARDAGEGYPLRGLVFAAGHFVAVRHHGPYMISRDGIHWSHHYAGDGSPLSASISNATLRGVRHVGGWFVAQDILQSAWISGDLVSWQRIEAPNGPVLEWESRLLGLFYNSVWESRIVRRPSQISISASRFSDEAGLVEGSFVISRRGALLEEAVVDLLVAGSAAPDVDYEPLPSRIVIPAGRASVEIRVRAKADQEADSDETVMITLQSGENFNLSGEASATLFIKDFADVPVFYPDEVSVGQNGIVQLKAYLPPAGSCVIEVSSDLKVWQELQTVMAGSSVVTFRDEAAGQTQRYYRARLTIP